jgi:hypothetical protein
VFAATAGIVKRSEVGKLVVLPRRWIVERTFAWLALSRHLNRDDEINPRHAETMIQWAISLSFSNDVPISKTGSQENGTGRRRMYACIIGSEKIPSPPQIRHSCPLSPDPDG